MYLTPSQRAVTMARSNTDLPYGLCCFGAYLPQSRGLSVTVVRFHTGLGLFLFVLCEA